MKALVFGSLNIDHVYQTPHMVRGGETLASAAYERHEGGKGLNQAVALAKAGQETWLAGNIGEDGAFLKGYLGSCGVDTSLIRTAERATGHAIIQVDSQGQNAILLYGGANQCVTADQRTETLSHFESGDWLLMQNEINQGAALIKEAKARGLTVAVNPSPISEELLGWPLEAADWLILNEIEGAALSGESEPEAMLEALAAKFPAGGIVLTLGEKGCLYARGEERLSQAIFPAKAVDTTAAGDTFTGYFLAGMMAGIGSAEALKRAACAAAIAVSRHGAGPAIPEAAEVEAKLGRG